MSGYATAVEGAERPPRYDVQCAGGCGLEAVDADDAMRLGWSLLPVTGRWRCHACDRELAAASRLGSLVPGPDEKETGE